MERAIVLGTSGIANDNASKESASVGLAGRLPDVSLCAPSFRFPGIRCRRPSCTRSSGPSFSPNFGKTESSRRPPLLPCTGGSREEPCSLRRLLRRRPWAARASSGESWWYSAGSIIRRGVVDRLETSSRERVESGIIGTGRIERPVITSAVATRQFSMSLRTEGC